METVFKRIDPTQYAHAWEDIPYAHQDPLQRLHIYTPGDEGNYPLLVYVNGGGWVQQLTRHNTIPGVWKAPSQGYALASIGYRLAPKNTWPAPLYDLKTAIRFLRAHADEYGYNADTLVAWGNSAGGHLISMCAATNNVPAFEDLTMGTPDQSSSLQGVILFYAPSDLYLNELETFIPNTEIQRMAESPHDLCDPRPGMDNLGNIELGCRAFDNPAVAAQASPIHYVTPNYPPTYLVHGMADPIIPYTQSTRLWNKIRFLSGDESRAQLELFPAVGHGDPIMKTDDVTRRMFDFVDTIVYGSVQDRAPLGEIAVLPS